MPKLILIAALSITACLSLPKKIAADYAHVLIISVDGLRPDALNEPLLSLLPAFNRLLRGPHTLDARTDANFTVTLPNHLSMLTGRPVNGPEGHGWKLNTDPPGATQGGSLHANKGEYVSSVFDVAHDAGFSTMVAASKSKFWLLQQSYSWEHGRADASAPDHGPSKIDIFTFADDMEDLGGMVADRLARANGPTLDFVHFAAPDIAGHSYDWIVKADSKYFAAVIEVDRALSLVLAAIDSNKHLRNTTAIILTADHGGGVPLKTHTDPTCPLNFRIPFIVWLGDQIVEGDLYALNPSRARPVGDARSATAAKPIHNADAANLALGLAGLPCIERSTFGFPTPLRVSPDSNSQQP
jgi:predicted AlkP superfamily pyrophosphatase or phosphodiesterase